MSADPPRPPTIAIHGWGLYEFDLDDQLKIASERGFEAMDVGSGDLGYGVRVEATRLANDPVECDRIAGLAAENGVRLTDMFVATPVPINDLSDEARLRNHEVVEGLARNAARIGLPGFTFSPGTYASVEWADAFELAATELRALVDIGSRHDVAIRVEPHVHSVADTPDRAQELVEAVPGLTFTLDYSHFVAAGFDQDALEPLHRYGTHWHARQARLGRLSIEVDQGTIDFRRLLAQLRKERYEGAIAVEYVRAAWEGQDQVDVHAENARMADELRRLIAEFWPDDG